MGPADPGAAYHLRVMTLNVRRRLPFSLRAADRWSARRHRVRALLRSERPTILATQEVLPDQARWVQRSLGEQYTFIGRGRDARGAGEGCPVFFDTERLELLEWEQLALSRTPEVAGSRSWGTVFPRVLVYARVRDRRTGAEFRVVNTHLDPFSARARVRSVELIRARALTGATPVILTGDFNAGPGSRTLDALLTGGALQDAWVHARRRSTPELATYANYRRPRPGARIDWIVTGPQVSVEEIGIVARPIDGGWPSDHLPVQAELTLTTNRSADDRELPSPTAHRR